MRFSCKVTVHDGSEGYWLEFKAKGVPWRLRKDFVQFPRWQGDHDSALLTTPGKIYRWDYMEPTDNERVTYILQCFRAIERAIGSPGPRFVWVQGGSLSGTIPYTEMEVALKGIVEHPGLRIVVEY